ncbi:hypothetical protein PROFUN_06273 [Planoprotostelium fungivorum]|uniref:Uncharacterized protein n=1 Tax=Planoprotostelium fungivorum TaxID=1890364 RepID=A0A2P6NEA3_9EUKA|nr:hypothetical protein PROFUN_06273 [Planoprotostelium fungivorum]
MEHLSFLMQKLQMLQHSITTETTRMLQLQQAKRPASWIIESAEQLQFLKKQLVETQIEITFARQELETEERLAKLRNIVQKNWGSGVKAHSERVSPRMSSPPMAY